jgi:hypothetical protein
MRDGGRREPIIRLGALAFCACLSTSGCSMVPRSRLEESHRLTETLRTDNARLKDQLVSLQTQNRDYADRAIDDLRRLTAREQAIERLQRSVQSYQDERDRMADAYRRLTASLGGSPDEGRPGHTTQTRPAPSDPIDGVRTALHEAPRSRGISSPDDGDAPLALDPGTADRAGP